MATKRPVLCPNCGAHIKKNGYCSSCHMPLPVLKKAFNTSDYYYNIGYDRAVARDLSGAIDSLNISLRYNKKNIMSRNLLGLVYYEMGEIVNALSQWVMSVNYQSSGNLASKYLKELRQDPTLLANVDQIAQKYNQALAYAKSEDFDLAIIQLKSVLSANPHFVKGYLLLALLYINSDNYERARTTLRRVLKIDKANTLAIHYLHEMGDTDENIIEMSKESVENDGLLEADEEAITLSTTGAKSGSKLKLFFGDLIERYKAKAVSRGEYGEISFAKYSGIYVLLGMLLGIFLLYFLVVPAQKRKIINEKDKLIKSYSEELADKNATINSLTNEIANLNIALDAAQNPQNESDNPLPDYSEIQNGMSDEDLQNLINNE
ncbi:MAG: tetratricopeptide repeat protein [Lachnospiraceae bacterium]|nr:tetratricopeptide repeat protein [Lachnospiraceae bacterium]